MSTLKEGGPCSCTRCIREAGGVAEGDIETKHDLFWRIRRGGGACLRSHRIGEQAYRYTGKGNAVAIVTDGTAVLVWGISARGGPAGDGGEGVSL